MEKRGIADTLIVGHTLPFMTVLGDFIEHLHVLQADCHHQLQNHFAHSIRSRFIGHGSCDS